MYDIFMSYASEDRPRAGQLAAALGKLGWKVWWDRTILPGKTFDKVVESELSAAPCVIVLWSKASVESQWVRAEAGEALNGNRLIPVLLEDVVIPLVFRQIQAAALLDWDGTPEHDGFTQLTRAITAFAAPSRTSDTQHPDADAVASRPQASEPPAPQPSGQLKSGRRSTSLFWPAATVSALFIAGLSVYLNWQKTVETGAPAIVGISPDPVAQSKQIDHDDAVPSAPGLTISRETEASPVAGQDSQPPSAMQAVIDPRESGAVIEPEPAVEPEPVIKPESAPIIRVTPPKPTQLKPPRLSDKRPTSPRPDSPVVATTTITPPKKVAPEPPPAPVGILIIVWGTPNDDGLASPGPTREYSDKLAQLMTGVIKDALRRPAKFDYRYIKDREHHALMRDNPKYKKSSALCSDTGVDLLVTGFVEGAEFDDSIGFLSTRRPYFSVFRCESGKGAAKRFKVAGTRGDSFPYEKSLLRVFRSFSRQEFPLE